ncbi:MAG: peptide-methionine (S)-S-oxide reductase MsrA [Pseudomonadota bacterium]
MGRLVGITAGAVALAIAAFAWSAQSGAAVEPAETPEKSAEKPGADDAIGIFAGGCFWCIEADFEKLEGVREAISGYTGGTVDNPTYKQVSYEDTGHYEAVQVYYDPEVVTYRELVDYFFRHVDPLDAGGQFCDRGASYRTAIFPISPEQRADAEASKAEAEKTLGETVVTPVIDASKFWIAEGYHQDYAKNNPLRYRLYRTNCGRDRRVAQVWAGKS